jgi:hypothetical protein
MATREGARKAISNRKSMSRRSHAVKLIMQWCRLNHPDIIDMAYEDAAKRYPYADNKGRLPKKVELPPNMRKAK